MTAVEILPNENGLSKLFDSNLKFQTERENKMRREMEIGNARSQINGGGGMKVYIVWKPLQIDEVLATRQTVHSTADGKLIRLQWLQRSTHPHILTSTSIGGHAPYLDTPNTCQRGPNASHTTIPDT